MTIQTLAKALTAQAAARRGKTREEVIAWLWALHNRAKAAEPDPETLPQGDPDLLAVALAQVDAIAVADPSHDPTSGATGTAETAQPGTVRIGSLNFVKS